MNEQKDIFDKDTEDFNLAIIKDDGLYRHLQGSNGRDSCSYFDIITYPGSLCYSGDMGCFVFQRDLDMFTFFRNKSGKINPNYWSEKLDAGIAKEFSQEYFLAKVDNIVNSVCSNIDRHFDGMSQKKLEQKAEDFKTEVKEYFEENDLSANGWFRTMYEFESEVIPKFDLSSDWEDECTVNTHQFLWCCHALVWAISKYDEHKAQQAAIKTETSDSTNL
jgi:hypothetical protein